MGGGVQTRSLSPSTLWRYSRQRTISCNSKTGIWLLLNSLACGERQSTTKYVAVKVLLAKYSLPARPCPEIDIARTLATFTDTGSRHILKLLDTFQQEGPNGVHTCLVYEPMAGTVASLVTTFPGNFPVPGQVFDYRPARYEKWMGKRILKHTLLGLQFLHQNNVVHSDLQPGNLLFSPHHLDDVPEADLTQSTTDETTVSLQRKDGKEDKWGPRYLALPQSLHKYANLEQDMCIKISDLGAAFLKGNPPNKIVTPVALRSPEVILGRPVDEKIDIWSFGCLVFELMTGTRLFPVDDLGSQEEVDDDHFLALHDSSASCRRTSPLAGLGETSGLARRENGSIRMPRNQALRLDQSMMTRSMGAMRLGTKTPGTRVYPRTWSCPLKNTSSRLLPHWNSSSMRTNRIRLTKMRHVSSRPCSGVSSDITLRTDRAQRIC